MGLIAVLTAILTVIKTVSKAITSALLYKSVYLCIGAFATRKFKPAKQYHKYAILIAARNEQTVIGNLIDSIKLQNYPQDKLEIFVVADNCTDDTAKISREAGAICYERFDDKRRTKGYALQYLIECIRRDYGIESYEGYLIFDADNLLDPDYMQHMNNSFDAGEKIVTSYRNTKNFDDNWIAASYGIHWLRTIRSENRPRSVLHLANRVQGTGYLFAHELIKDGWKWVCLTEDRYFCADAVAKGYKISYNHDAIFYDEQPVSLKIAMRQRIRWAKGNIFVFFKVGPKLIWHIFFTGGVASAHEKGEVSKGKRLFNNLRLRFMSFDMLTNVYTRPLFASLKRFICFGLEVWLFCLLAPNVDKPTVILTTMICQSFMTYGASIIMAIYIYFIERKRIQKIGFFKKLWYILTFPIFGIIGEISFLIALFTKVEWKPIPHASDVKITDLTENAEFEKEKQKTFSD